MSKETKEISATKERIIILEKSKATDEGPIPMGISCCYVTLFPLKFW